MDIKKLLFIYNPKSGKGRIKTRLSDVIDLCVKDGYEVTIRPTQAHMDAMNYIAANGNQYDKIICSGGDGTLDEVIKGVLTLENPVPVGYIPAGSTNDFAGSLGISSLTLKAAKTALYGRLFACDIGKFNENYFVYVAAFGFMTEVSYETDQKAKNVLGHMAYIAEALKNFTPESRKAYHMSLITEDRIIKDDFIYGMVSNSASIGGMKILPVDEIALDDGEFEVLLVKYPRYIEEINLMISSLLAQEPDPAYIYYFKASHLEMHFEEPVAWTLDGENGGMHKDVEINNINKAFQICVPDRKKEKTI